LAHSSCSPQSVSIVRHAQLRKHNQWRKSDWKFGEGGTTTLLVVKNLKVLIHIISHDKTSDTVEDNLYNTKTKLLRN